MSSETQRHATSSEASKASKPSKKVKKTVSSDAPVPKKAKTDKHSQASPQRSQPSASNPALSPNRQSSSPVSVSSEPRSVLSRPGSREDLASLYRDIPLHQHSPRRAAEDGTDARTLPHHLSALYWHPSMPGMAQESSANPEPFAWKHSDKQRCSVSPKDNLPTSKWGRHDTTEASEAAHPDRPARDQRRHHSACSLPSSSDPWLVARSPYHQFPVLGFPPYPGFLVPPTFMPPRCSLRDHIGLLCTQCLLCLRTRGFTKRDDPGTGLRIHLASLLARLNTSSHRQILSTRLAIYSAKDPKTLTELERRNDGGLKHSLVFPAT
ncbi:hypothetical protein JRQ81_001685 [Phrynocephalus forsythii]|uniref:Uncharacterized protein n=1 Tax=Phrynocephalus forsythii TaxID=171643 RepID=A0A9Q1B9H1_9SAUR|nr:hypothetical protein JRQ81_001685 [Phrynocephalus forsythii]